MDKRWPAETVTSVRELFQKLDWLCEEPRLVFRGQSKAIMPLEPTIDRGLGERLEYAARLEEEERLIDRFCSEAKPFLPPLERDYCEGDRVLRMTVMRHYGAPTRLLDWTESALVAAYFACVYNVEELGAVFWLDAGRLSSVFADAWDALGYPRTLNDRREINYNDRVFDSNVEALVGPIHFSTLRFARAQAQRGLFTICTRLGEAHDRVLHAMMQRAGAPSGTLGLIKIPASLKEKALRHLEHLGIDAASTKYPGADYCGLRMSFKLLDERTRRGDS